MRYWDAAGVTTRELRQWFHKMWRGICQHQGKELGRENTKREENWGGKGRESKGKERQRDAEGEGIAALLSLMTPPPPPINHPVHGDVAMGSQSNVAQSTAEREQRGPVQASEKRKDLSCPQAGMSSVPCFRQPQPLSTDDVSMEDVGVENQGQKAKCCIESAKS